MLFGSINGIICLLILFGRLVLAYECTTAGNSAKVPDIHEAAVAIRQMEAQLCVPSASPELPRRVKRTSDANCTVVITHKTVSISMCGHPGLCLFGPDLAQEVDKLREKCAKFAVGMLRARGFHFDGSLRVDLGIAL